MVIENQKGFKSFDSTAAIRRRAIEGELFKIIKREVSNNKKVFKKAAVVNALSIRPYVSLNRLFNDLDIAFPADIPFEEIKNIAKKCKEFVRIDIDAKKPENSTLHVVYFEPHMSEIEQNLAKEFSLHLQSGGIWYNEKCFFLDEEFFKTVEWKDVQAADGSKASLPIPKIEELFILKLKKFVGNDLVDILSILTLARLDIEYIEKRVNALRIGNDIYCNLFNVNSQLHPLLINWSYQFLCEMNGKTKSTMKKNLEILLKRLK